MTDCHLHLQDPRLRPDLPSILAGLRETGVTRLVVNGTHPGDWDEVEILARHHPEVTPFFGLHPWQVGTESEGWLEELEVRLRRWPGSGVGEIGLDRWKRGLDFGRQREAFAAQLELARRLDRPAALHGLQAWGSLHDDLAAVAPGGRYLLHSYGGPREMVASFAAAGAWFSISGYFFRPEKQAKLATFDLVPEDRLLVETDAPDMALPGSLRTHFLPDPELNHPANLGAVHAALARHRGLSRENLETLLEKNFASWMGTPPP